LVGEFLQALRRFGALAIVGIGIDLAQAPSGCGLEVGDFLWIGVGHS
jgi:hypothetical protein